MSLEACYKKLFFPIQLLAIIGVLGQGSTLNAFLVIQNDKNLNYLLFIIADIFILFTLLFTFLEAHWKNVKDKSENYMRKGYYPLIAVSWAVYIAFYIARVCLIYGQFIRCVNVSRNATFVNSTENITPADKNLSRPLWNTTINNITKLNNNPDIAPLTLDERLSCSPTITNESSLTINHLRFVQSLTALIFLLMLFAHRNNHSKKDLVEWLTEQIAVDLLDSIELLDVLIVMNSGIILPVGLDTAVIAVSCLNFVFPLIPLTALNIPSDHGATGPMTIAYKLIHMLFINCTLLGLRLFMWTAYGTGFSVFMMKNIVYIYVAIQDTLTYVCGSGRSSYNDDDIMMPV